MSTPPPDPSQQPSWDAGGSWGQQPGHQQGGYGGPPTDHPRATMVLVLGILGLVCCGLLAPVAWIMGKGVVSEIDAAPHRYSGRGQANAGRICGIIGTVLIILGFAFFLLMLALGGMAAVSLDSAMPRVE